MKSKTRILILADQIQQACGVSTHLYHFIKNIVERETYDVMLLAGKLDSLHRINELQIVIKEIPDIHHEERGVANFVRAIALLRKIIHQFQPQIIHSHHYYSAAIADLAAMRFKIPKFQTVHAIVKKKGKLPLYPGDVLVAVNEHIYDHLQLHQKSKPLYLVRCGVNVETEAMKSNREKIGIVTLSRLEKEKGVDVFIKAVSKIPGEIRDKCEFIIAGDGSEYSALVELTKKLKVEIQFPGLVNEPIKFLNDVNIYVHPSRSTMEGFPLAMVEAGMCGNLIITSKFWGHDSIVRDEDAMKFNVDDSEELAERLIEAIKNFNNYEAMISGFQIKLKSIFGVEATTNELISLYKKHGV